MPISMLWSGLVRIRENDGRTNDDREKDVVPISSHDSGPNLPAQYEIVVFIDLFWFYCD